MQHFRHYHMKHPYMMDLATHKSSILTETPNNMYYNLTNLTISRFPYSIVCYKILML